MAIEQFEKWFEKEGKEIIDSYQNHYSSIKEVMEDTWAAAELRQKDDDWKMRNEEVL